MRLTTTGFAEMILELEGALAWLGDFGVATKTKRHATYLRHLKKIDKRWQEQGNMRAADVPIDAKRMETALVETSQLIRIWRAFRDSPPAGLEAKLRIYAGGPELERDEEPRKSGNSARDCGFELDVAAHFQGVGPLDLTRGVDVVVDFQTIAQFIECKRPSSPDMIAENLDRASEAISAELRSTRLASYGIPAISLAKVDWPGGVVIQGRSKRDIENALTAWIRRIDAQYLHEWFQRQSDGRVIAVLVHLPYVGYIGDSPSIAGVQFALIGSRLIQGTVAHQDMVRLTSSLDQATRALHA